MLIIPNCLSFVNQLCATGILIPTNIDVETIQQKPLQHQVDPTRHMRRGGSIARRTRVVVVGYAARERR
jgi:hypothetical protein